MTRDVCMNIKAIGIAKLAETKLPTDEGENCHMNKIYVDKMDY